MSEDRPTTQLADASQWRLMWMRFRRHRLALAGSAVLIALYGLAALCEFVSPYQPDQRHAQYVLCPPQEIRFFDGEGRFHCGPLSTACGKTRPLARGSANISSILKPCIRSAFRARPGLRVLGAFQCGLAFVQRGQRAVVPLWH